MTETLEPVFAATHMLNGIPVMHNPDWHPGRGGSGPHIMWIDEGGAVHGSRAGQKAVPIAPMDLPAATLSSRGEKFGQSYGLIGEKIPSEWWISSFAQYHTSRGVMITRDAAAAVLRACAWPDSAAPCGQAGNSNDDDATFEGKDQDGNCIVRLFMRGIGYFRVRVPAAMFLEIVDE